MLSKQICYHGWDLTPRDEQFAGRHFTDARHRCGLPPGHDGTCVCRECGAPGERDDAAH